MAHCRSSRPGRFFLLRCSLRAAGSHTVRPGRGRARIAAVIRGNQYRAGPARCVPGWPIWAAYSGRERPLMVVMQVIVRHQDRCARRLDHRHDAAIRVQRADSISQKWTFCTWRKVRRHGCWDGQSWPI